MGNLNSSMTSKKIELVIQNQSTKKSPEPYGFMNEFYLIYKEDLTSIFFKFLQKEMKRRKHFQNQFMKPSLP